MRIYLFLSILFTICIAQWEPITYPSEEPFWDEYYNITLSSPGVRTRHFMFLDKGEQYIWIGLGQHDDTQYYEDVWKYDISLKRFYWVLGRGEFIPAADTSSSSNNPRARSFSLTWVDNDGNLWLYGGTRQVNSYQYYFSDMWKLDVSDIDYPNWTLISGPTDFPFNFTRASYNGTLTPGCRSESVTWTDSHGNFYLFGGFGLGSYNATGTMNDMWMFNYTTLLWDYLGGSHSAVVTDQYWSYGIQGQPSATNWPYHRRGAQVYTINNVVFMIGGQIELFTFGIDVWKWENSTWTWIGGPPVNETAEGLSTVYKHFLEFSKENSLSPRGHAISWEYEGNLWLFGGYGAAKPTLKCFRDVWVYNVSLNMWAWVSYDDGNAVVPTARYGMGKVMFNSSVLVFGGYDQENGKYLSDLWLFDFTMYNFSVNNDVEDLTSSGKLVGNTKSRASVIAVAIVIPIIAVVAITLLAVLFFVKRKRDAADSDSGEAIAMETVVETPSTEYAGTIQGVNVGKLIGTGSFGEVYYGTWNQTPVALKKIKQEYFQVFKKEADTLMKLTHPQIVQYLGVYVGNEPFIVMELMNAGNLQTILQTKTDLTDIDLLTMAVDAARGLSYIHSNNIIHRDFSLRNLLVSSSGSGKYTIKISDFGLSAVLQDTDYYKSESKVLPYKWASTEVLKYGKYSTASDVWAFGVTLWELYSAGTQPYTGMSNVETTEYVLQGKRLSKPEKCPSEVFTIMQECWLEKTKDRPTMVAVHGKLQGLLFRLDAKVEEKPLIEQTNDSELYNN